MWSYAVCRHWKEERAQVLLEENVKKESGGNGGYYLPNIHTVFLLCLFLRLWCLHELSTAGYVKLAVKDLITIVCGWCDVSDVATTVSLLCFVSFLESVTFSLWFLVANVSSTIIQVIASPLLSCFSLLHIICCSLCNTLVTTCVFVIYIAILNLCVAKICDVCDKFPWLGLPSKFKPWHTTAECSLQLYLLRVVATANASQRNTEVGPMNKWAVQVIRKAENLFNLCSKLSIATVWS